MSAVSVTSQTVDSAGGAELCIKISSYKKQSLDLSIWWREKTSQWRANDELRQRSDVNDEILRKLTVELPLLIHTNGELQCPPLVEMEHFPSHINRS